MARRIRIQSAGAYYHVMARGNRRETVLNDDEMKSAANVCEQLRRLNLNKVRAQAPEALLEFLDQTES